MPDATAFQQAFGAALAGRAPVADPLIARALTIHRNTATKAASDALADNYPVLRAMVGDDAFTALATAFVEDHPPADPRLCFYGEGLPAFVADWEPFADYPYLVDVARLERLLVEALFAADAPALDGGEIDLDLTRPLRLHPAVRFAAFASPAGALWRAHQPDAPTDAFETIDWAPEAVLVTRPDGGLIVSALPGGGAAFLAACAAGAPLGDAAAAAGDDLAPLFSLLISAGAFA